MSEYQKRFSRFALPAPPPELRDRALRAAHAAARQVAPTTAPTAGWSRWDLAWVGALLILVVCHLVLPSHRGLDGVASVAHRAVTPCTPAVRPVPDQEWREIGVFVATNHTQARPEQPLTVKRWVEDPTLERLATE